MSLSLIKAKSHIISSALIILLACTLGTCGRENHLEKLFFTEISSVNKLVLAQMTVSKMAVIDDLNLDDAEGLKQTATALINAAKVGSRKAAYSYSTYLRAYIDLSDLTPDDIKVDESSRTVTLTLPPIHTEYLGRDLEIREEHYRVTGLRSDIDAGERAALKERMNSVLKNEVERNPMFRTKLINEAKAKARAYFSSLLGKDGYTVNVKFQND